MAGQVSCSPEQIKRALAGIDRVYRANGLPGPSEYRRDYLIARMMWLVAGRERPLQLLEWLHERYRVTLADYLRDA